MPTYESPGSLTTIEQSYSSPQTPDLTGLVYTLNGETIGVDVVGSPGEAGEEIVSQSLGGATSYDLSWTSGHTDFEVVFNLSTGDTNVTPEVDDLVLTGRPDAPTDLTVSEVTDAPDVSLSWSDNATTEDEYRVYRATSPGTVVGDYTLVDTLAADSTTYTDTTVSLGTRYYYRVTAASGGGESPVSNEVRAEPNADDLTESVVWDSESEWVYGEFSNVETDGAGVVSLQPQSGDITFDYSLSIDSTSGADEVSVSVEDNTGTQLDRVEITGSDTQQGTITVSVEQPQPYTLIADLFTVNDTSASASASITDPYGNTVNVSDADGDNVVVSESYDYTHPESGTWTSPYWDYTNATTTAAILNTSTQPTDTSISAVVEPEGGTASSSVTLTAGTDVADSVEVASNDRYRLVVTLATDIVDGSTPTPTLDLVGLEAHTPPSTLQITSTDATSNQLSWTGWGAADAYELYRSESTPVTTNDTLLTTTTSTTYTDSGLENGEAYYYNVRAVYTGE